MKTAMREKMWAEKYPELETGPVPTEPMFSEEHFALERDRIFRRTWINVGRVEDIPEPGNYFTVARGGRYPRRTLQTARSRRRLRPTAFRSQGLRA